MEVRPCKWRRRHQISERMWHCTEEEVACEEKISRIEASQRKLQPEEPKEKTTFVFHPEDMDYEPDPADDFYTAEMAEIDELHIEIDVLKEAAEWDEMSNERQLRKKDQSLHDMQTLGLLEYIDQLEGLLEEVNEDWKANVRRLDAEGDLTGKEIDVYFNGPHPKETFALRYREDLGSTPKWRVIVERKSGQNRYFVKQDFPPHKWYLMALGKDKRGHIFAFNFLSTFGLKWMNAETEMGLSKSKVRSMSTYERFQWFDKLSAMVTAAKAKKKARG